MRIHFESRQGTRLISYFYVIKRMLKPTYCFTKVLNRLVIDWTNEWHTQKGKIIATFRSTGRQQNVWKGLTIKRRSNTNASVDLFLEAFRSIKCDSFLVSTFLQYYDWRWRITLMQFVPSMQSQRQFLKATTYCLIYLKAVVSGILRFSQREAVRSEMS